MGCNGDDLAEFWACIDDEDLSIGERFFQLGNPGPAFFSGSNQGQVAGQSGSGSSSGSTYKLII